MIDDDAFNIIVRDLPRTAKLRSETSQFLTSLP